MEECRERCRRLKEICFDGEVTMTKTTLWMVAGLCLLAGLIWIAGKRIRQNQMHRDGVAVEERQRLRQWGRQRL